MRTQRLDHLVLTVTDLPATIGFYTSVCGMSHVVFADDRHGLTFGNQRINLHVWGSEFEPKAALATPGSADLCLLVDSTPEQTLARLGELQVPVVHGPVEKVGATGPMTSVYVRDPDGNLIELSTPAAVDGGGRAARSGRGETGEAAGPAGAAEAAGAGRAGRVGEGAARGAQGGRNVPADVPGPA